MILISNKEAVKLSLNELWFVLIAVLFTGFFFLEGFDFGVGMATQLLARDNSTRRVLINTIGPFWDANEVWLITAAGAMFAAFPHWYSTLFSGYYIFLTFILLALIVRGVAFEFRSKLDSAGWRKVWDAAIFIGSIVPPFLFGMIFASLAKGMPIGSDMELSAGFTDFINGYTLWGGLTITGLCLLHGLTFISLRTTDEIRSKARKTALRLLPFQAVLLTVLTVWTYLSTDLFKQHLVLLTITVIAGIWSVVFARHFLIHGKEGWSFAMTSTLMAVTTASLFIGLFPRVMISSLDSAYHLTILNAASSPYTLKAMTIVVVTLLPFVLGYQIWSYFVFRKRVSNNDHLEY